jgi:nucleotide-binding universal stress UspA family protein
MPYVDLLLPTLTWPDPTPDRALRSGVALARRLGGELTLAPLQVTFPDMSNPLADALAKVGEMAALERARSAAVAALEETCARLAAEELGVAISSQTATARLYAEGEAVAVLARTRDLCLVPLGVGSPGRGLAEAALFGSGRPVLVYPEHHELEPGPNLGLVSIAWDGGAKAACAVAAALPLLARAREVRIFVALGEKDQATHGAAAPLVRHLRAHGVAAEVDERLAHDRPIGRRFGDYVAEVVPDLLVMGGFGHARLREFVLGGATAAILADPPCPTLLAH